jgi:hypothetical protein
MPVRRPILATAIALCVLGAAAACSPFEYDILTDGLTSDQPVTEVHIKGGSGAVKVLPDSGVKGVNLIRTVRYHGSAPGDTYRLDGSVLSVDTGCGVYCSASYEVRVPPRGSGPGVTVTGSNASGDITIRGAGRVDIGVSSGDVEVTDVDQPVTVTSTSGDLTLGDIGGTLVATVTSGDVHGRNLHGGTSTIQVTSGDVTLDLPGTGDVTAHATSGDINVTVPDATCRVHADSRSGDTRVTVAAGTGHLLDVTTASGDVTVKPSP